MTRISKQQGYLEIAKAVSLRSTCVRRRYGCVIVNNDEIVGTGFNGASRGEINCIDGGVDYCIRKKNNIPQGSNYEQCFGIHSEMNGIISAGRKLCLGASLYLYGFDTLVLSKYCSNSFLYLLFRLHNISLFIFFITKKINAYLNAL